LAPTCGPRASVPDMNQPISAEAREWAIEQIKAHGEYSSLDDLLQQAETMAQKYVKSDGNQ
jgi:hypothetical protein